MVSGGSMKQTKYDLKDYKESNNMFYWIFEVLLVEIWQRRGQRADEIFWQGSRL